MPCKSFIMNTASVFNIQKFSIHDGPGIRTVVFLKGCPLKCLWCANPESQKTEPELEVFPENCIKCGECIKVCPNNAISFGAKGIQVDRKKCTNCGICTEVCYSQTLKFIGEEKSVEEVLSEIAKDEAFYKNSGGGYTLSGGEPLKQSEFCIELIKECKNKGYHGAIETSAFGDTKVFKEITELLDFMYIDIKHMDASVHTKGTGVSNKLILKNIREIQDIAKEIVIRTPIIPGYNDSEENIRSTAEFCKDLKAVHKWELLPYHKLGVNKFKSIGRKYKLDDLETPSKGEVLKLVATANKILKPVEKECVADTTMMKED